MSLGSANSTQSRDLSTGLEVLFIAYDGVLQTPALDDWMEMEHSHALEQLLERRPNLRLVVAATQLETSSEEEVVEMLPEALRARVIGAIPTHPQGRSAGGREALILQWLAAYGKVARWVAVDYEALLYERGCPWLVQTHKWMGWDDFTTEQVEALLNGVIPAARTVASLGGWPGYGAEVAAPSTVDHEPEKHGAAPQPQAPRSRSSPAEVSSWAKAREDEMLALAAKKGFFARVLDRFR